VQVREQEKGERPTQTSTTNPKHDWSWAGKARDAAKNGDRQESLGPKPTLFRQSFKVIWRIMADTDRRGFCR
jgi:hypothetical protein